MNKDHWYDGQFYDKIIAPNQDRVYELVKSIISPDSTILDAGCGTGRLAFRLEGYFSRYVGVDLSRRNIETAEGNLSKNPASGVNFYHSGIHEFLENRREIFDYAVMSYVIHEIEESEREKILKHLSDYADQIIIVDYLFPRTKGFWSLLNEAVEFFAGKEHYYNFKSFIAAEGIPGLTKKTGLRVIKEIKNLPKTSHIAVLSK